jgi:hypothetical protein
MIMLHRMFIAFIVALVAICAAPQAFARKVGPQFQVNTFTQNQQDKPAVAALEDGGFVVVWQSFAQDGDEGGVYGQRYHANGARNGDEFRVNTTTVDDQEAPTVAALSNGGFVVVWTSKDGSGYGIYAQRFRPDGTPAGTEFRANTFTALNQTDPAVAGLSGGGFVVVWTSQFQDGNGAGVYGQLYRNDGTPVGQEFRINTYTANDQRRPAVAALGNGGFVVVWDSRDQDARGYSVFGRRFRANGTPLGAGQFRVNRTAKGSQWSASIASLGEDGFVVVWHEPIPDVIFGRLFDRTGALAPEFLIDQPAVRFPPSVAALGEGRFVVVWTRFEGTCNICGQRYDAAGNKERGRFLVNSTGSGGQPAVAGFTGFSNGRFVAVWASSDGIFGQRFSD